MTQQEGAVIILCLALSLINLATWAFLLWENWKIGLALLVIFTCEDKGHALFAEAMRIVGRK